MTRTLLPVLGIALILSLSACGNKGPLIPPPESGQQTEKEKKS